MRTILTALLAAGLLGVPAAAQYRSASPDSELATLDPEPKAREKKKRGRLTPMALAITLVFDSSTWSAIGVSTAAPVGEIASLLGAGYYRLELLQLILMADRSGKHISLLTADRVKEKKSLRDIAKELGLEYDSLYDEAVARSREVDRRVKTVSRVAVFTKEKL
ncbi:MAG: hypothetical protein V3S11_05125 [Elusimicrobiota bacterium]